MVAVTTRAGKGSPLTNDELDANFTALAAASGSGSTVGLFANVSSLTIPVGTDFIQTSGYSAVGEGAARYIYNAAIDSSYVAANPRTSFVSANSRGFTLDPQQRLTIQMFGGRADGAISTSLGGIFGAYGATDNSAALNIALLFYQVNKQFSGLDFYVRGSPEIHFPAADGVYDFQSTVEIRTTLRLTGDNTKGGGGETSILRWRPAMHGLVFHFFLSDLSGSLAHFNYTSTGCTVQGLCIFQAATGNDYTFASTKYHGIYARSAIHVRDCNIKNWSGAGIYGLGGVPDTNVNIGSIYHSYISGNEHGVWLDGGDANVWTGVGLDCQANRGYGIWDSSFLGNTWIGCHTDSNGVKSSGDASSVCSYSGNQYFVRPGQAVGASTNAPSGTSAINTWWGYIRAGGADSSYVAWTSGLTWREGGAYRTDSTGNVRTLFLGCYSEGTNGASYFVYPTFVLGGLLNSPTEPGGATVFDNSLGNTTLESGYFDVLTGGYKVGGTIVIDPSRNATLAATTTTTLASTTITGSTSIKCTGSGGLGYNTGSGGAVTQGTSRTTGVTLNKTTGSVTLFSAAGDPTNWTSFNISNNTIASTDTVLISQISGTDDYHVVARFLATVGIRVSFKTTGGTTTEQPVFQFSIIKSVAS